MKATTVTRFQGKRSDYALQLAQAALAIAKANHYLVGYSSCIRDTSFDDWSDARQILIDAELHACKRGPRDCRDTRAAKELFGRALRVVTLECMRQHRVDLSA